VEFSLTYDCNRQEPLDAAAGISEYWLLNLRERRLA
jgi:hypothetical protein